MRNGGRTNPAAWISKIPFDRAFPSEFTILLSSIRENLLENPKALPAGLRRTSYSGLVLRATSGKRVKSLRQRQPFLLRSERPGARSFRVLCERVSITNLDRRRCRKLADQALNRCHS